MVRRPLLSRSWSLLSAAATAGTLSLALSSLARAQPEPPPAAAPAPAAAASQPMSKGEAKAIREFNMLDMNGDGKLSRKEVAIIPRLAAAFDEADTNHDNYVTLEEVRAFAAKYRAERDRARAAAQDPESPKAADPAAAKP